MSQTNVWQKFQFTKKSQKSALDYLQEFKDDLIKSTSGELTMDIETVDAYFNTTPPKVGAIYILYVVAPKLGNFRRKILTVAEYSDIGRFPVDIVNHYLEDKSFPAITEADFKKKIEENLSNPIVKNSIENLFTTSKSY